MKEIARNFIVLVGGEVVRVRMRSSGVVAASRALGTAEVTGVQSPLSMAQTVGCAGRSPRFGPRLAEHGIAGSGSRGEA